MSPKATSKNFMALYWLSRGETDIGAQVIYFVLYLMQGGLKTHDAINAYISDKPLEDMHTDTHGNITLSRVIASKARKWMKKHDIEFKIVWSKGYLMELDNITKLKALIERHSN